MERLTFNVGRSGHPSEGTLVVAGRGSRLPRSTPRSVERAKAVVSHARKTLASARERYDADYLWMIAFTALLFFRPQDQIPGLGVLHLSELTAIAGLAAMASRRLSTGQTIAKVNTEVLAIVALGGVILATMPFSIWPGGAVQVFSDTYVKIILIFTLMISTLTSPRRIRQMTWVMLMASGYVAFRAVFDYLRGANLVEGDRVRGALGGMFENPNDLALNLVTFLAPTLFIVLQDRRTSRRLGALALALLMLGAIVCTKSRSGFLGLVAVGLVVAYYTVRVRPGAVLAMVLVGALALPAAPQSFWNRMDSIMNAEEDPTGSRAARLRLLEQGVQVFIDNPITGIGAGQFKNYDGPGVMVERWRVTHNVWLQVAAELGIFGLALFAFLVYRAYYSCAATNRLLRERKTKKRGPPPATLDVTDEERTILAVNARGMMAAIAGWTVCAFFASVAFNWTFYYVLALAVAGREIAKARRVAQPRAERARMTTQAAAGRFAGVAG
jgi:putative inorganic carbon (hco3(-)) transporter